MSSFQSFKNWARQIKRDSLTLWFVCRNPATPWAPKMLCFFVVGYALSPIDLIPDFTPVLGYLDGVLLPGLVWLTLRLLPSEIVEDGRARADRRIAERGEKPRSVAGAVIIVVV